MNMVEKIRKASELRTKAVALEAEMKTAVDALRFEARRLMREVEMEGADLDLDKIRTAQEVLVFRGSYARGGEDRGSVIADAVNEIATGDHGRRRGLNYEDYGTKNYDRWQGQRCDCGPYSAPTHGSIVFSVGLTEAARKAGGIIALTEEQREAAVYVLTRLEKIQSIEAKARQEGQSA